jgi:hypothetical protein
MSSKVESLTLIQGVATAYIGAADAFAAWIPELVNCLHYVGLKCPDFVRVAKRENKIFPAAIQAAMAGMGSPQPLSEIRAKIQADPDLLLAVQKMHLYEQEVPLLLKSIIEATPTLCEAMLEFAWGGADAADPLFKLASASRTGAFCEALEPARLKAQKFCAWIAVEISKSSNPEQAADAKPAALRASVSSNEIKQLVEQWEQQKSKLTAGDAKSLDGLAFVEAEIDARAAAIIAANPGKEVHPIKEVRFDTVAAELLKTIGSHLATAAREHGIDATAIDAVAADPARAMPATWRAAELAIGKLRIAAPASPSAEGANAIASASADPTNGEPPKPRYSFKRVGNMWEIWFDGEHGHFSRLAGFGIIAKLLFSPDPSIPIEAIDLLEASAAIGGAPAEATPAHEDGECSVRHSNRHQAAMDKMGIDEIKAALADVQAKRAAARATGNISQIDKLEAEEKELSEYLRKNTGLGNRPRNIDGKAPREKARVLVRKNINLALAKLSKAQPAMSKCRDHLFAAIKTKGSAYAYRPQQSITWQL